ncbi:MAG: RNA 3'-terminal phosphate cyclase [Acidiferrobacterales bacterium]
MVEIDGASGEGGGQILRSALALSVMTRQPMRITNIRARRPKPGLMPQHLKAVEAAAAISQAHVQGARVGSLSLFFDPRITEAGEYHFDIGTAGAATLVLQTIAVPLSFAGASSVVSITGGTHVPWSPSYHYLAWHWIPYLARSGFRLDTTLERPGFYPRGGGHITLRIQPLTGSSPVTLVRRGELKQIRGLSMVASLDESIAMRQRRQAVKRLIRLGVDINIEMSRLSSYSPGTALILIAEFEETQCCYGALGARGKPAERVADEAVDALEAFLATGAAIDEHLADQLMLPLCVVPAFSQLRVPQITQHLITNADIVRQFLPVHIDIAGESGKPGQVKITGMSPTGCT